MLEKKFVHTFKSKNFDNRSKKSKIKYIILHYTETKNLNDAIKLLCSKKRKVSAHYVIDLDGKIYLLVEDTKRAWHAGLSSWKNEKYLNETSIGIEIVNEGEQKKKKYPKIQIKSVILLLKYLKNKFQIKKPNILAHSDIAPTRKIDPGVFFPWEELAKNSLSNFSKIKREKNDFDMLTPKELVFFFNCLKILGFHEIEVNGSFSKNKLISNAFHRHYFPQLINKKPRKISVRLIKKIINLTKNI